MASPTDAQRPASAQARRIHPTQEDSSMRTTQSRYRPAAIAALALAAALASAPAPAFAAGRGNTLSKAEVIRRGSLICKAGERKVDALPQIQSQHPLTGHVSAGERQRAILFIAGYADALAGVRHGLAGLKAPAQDHALLAGFITDLGPAITAFREAHADALAGRNAAAESEAGKAFALFAKASAKTRAYGFPKGVCQSGAS
jgi:hypothetical protein